MGENEISGVIIDVAIDLHRRLGPGLFESVVEAGLAHFLNFGAPTLKEGIVRIANHMP